MLGLLAAALPVLMGASQTDPPLGGTTDWREIYKGDTLPESAGWGTSKGENTRAEVTEEGLLIVDAGAEATQLHCYSKAWKANPCQGASARATVKVASCTGRSGMCLHVSDGLHEEGLTLYPDRIVLSNACLAHAMDTTDRFHTYELRICGRNILCFADGQLVLDGWGRFDKAAHNGRCLVMFGSISSPSTSEAVWKEVRYKVEFEPAERPEGTKDVIVFRERDVYACFPTLCRLKDGRLYTRFGTRTRRSHIDNTGGSAGAVSSDEGWTWTITDELLEDPRFLREDGARIVPHAQGWVYVDESELPRIEKEGRTWMKAREGTVAYLGEPRVRVISPEGETTLIELDNPCPSGVMSFHHASSFLREGSLWLTAIYGRMGEEKLGGVWGIRSGDNGASWHTVEIASPYSAGKGFNETAICDNGQGELIAVIRPRDESMNSYQCFSSDAGKTWGPPQDTGFWGYPSHLLLLEDGRLLCTRGFRREPMGVRAALSRNGGHSWELARDIVIRCDGRGNPGDNGYPISIQKSDGGIFTIYYINDQDNVTHVAGTHWELPR